MAGHTAENCIDPSFYEVAAPICNQLVSYVTHKRLRIDLSEQGRGFPHRNGGSSELLYDKPECLQIIRNFEYTGSLCISEFDDFRDQKRLTRSPVFSRLCLQSFVDQAFVCRVLIHDDNPIARLRDDVVLMHLAAGGSERTVFCRRTLVLLIMRTRLTVRFGGGKFLCDLAADGIV